MVKYTRLGMVYTPKCGFFFGKESGSRSGKGAVTEDTQRRRVPRI